MTTEGRRSLGQAAAFVVILVALDLVLGGLLTLLTPFADPKSSPVGLLEAVRRDRDAAVLVLGSSRANHHVNSRVLSERLGKKVHNAGLDGQSVVFARAVQEFAWASGVRPEFFILQIEAFDVISYQPSRAFGVTPYLSSMPSTRETFARERYNVKVKLLSRSFRFNSLVVQLALNGLRGRPPADEDSFEPLSGSLVGNRWRMMGVPGRFQDRSRDVSPEAIRVLRQFVRAASEAGSTALIVTGPYLRGTPVPAAETRALEAIEEAVTSEGGLFVQIDERNHPVFDDPALYADPAHLNRTGADIYSMLLSDLIADLSGLQPVAAGADMDSYARENK